MQDSASGSGCRSSESTAYGASRSAGESTSLITMVEAAARFQGFTADSGAAGAPAAAALDSGDETAASPALSEEPLKATPIAALALALPHAAAAAPVAVPAPPAPAEAAAAAARGELKPKPKVAPGELTAAPVSSKEMVRAMPAVVPARPPPDPDRGVIGGAGGAAASAAAGGAALTAAAAPASAAGAGDAAADAVTASSRRFMARVCTPDEHALALLVPAAAGEGFLVGVEGAAAAAI